MVKEDEKESCNNLFAAMQRVASRNDFLYQKIVGVMGDYVESQSFISDLIYVSHQDRELLLPLFPPRRLDVSYHGFGLRNQATQPSVKVAALRDVQPRPISPTLSLQVMAKNVPDTPKTKVSGFCVKTQENHENCSTIVLNSRSTPSPMTVNIKFPSNDTFPVPEIQTLQKNTSLKSVESIKSKQSENMSPLLNNQFDRKQMIDTDDMINEMTLPRLISPINSPETRMSVEMVLEEMVTNISPLSPISNPKRQNFTVIRKDNRNILSARENCDEYRNIHSVQDILGDISSSDEEETAYKSADLSARESIFSKAAVIDTTENLLPIEENKQEKLDAPNLCKGDSKIPRPIFSKNLFESPKIEKRPGVDVCLKKIPDNPEKEFRASHNPKEITNSVKRPVSSSDSIKFQRTQHKMKIAPPSASQIVSRPKNVMPLCLQGKDKQQISSNILQTKDKAYRHYHPVKHISTKTQHLIDSSYPKQQHQSTTVVTNENMISVLCNISKDVSAASNSHQTFMPVITAEQKSLTRSPKDVCLQDKSDTISPKKQLPIAESLSERALPNSKLSNSACISIVSDPVSKELKPCTISPHEKSSPHNFSPANRQVTFLKAHLAALPNDTSHQMRAKMSGHLRKKVIRYLRSYLCRLINFLLLLHPRLNHLFQRSKGKDYK